MCFKSSLVFYILLNQFVQNFKNSNPWNKGQNLLIFRLESKSPSCDRSRRGICDRPRYAVYGVVGISPALSERVVLRCSADIQSSVPSRVQSSSSILAIVETDWLVGKSPVQSNDLLNCKYQAKCQTDQCGKLQFLNLPILSMSKYAKPNEVSKSCFLSICYKSQLWQNL